MDLLEKILKTPQREISGEDSESAFAYQKNWAFSEMLKFQLQKKEYVFIFEYHDDILVLDSEKPSKITFVQIKKSDKNPWTIVRLTKSEMDKDNKPKLSIIGKLYSHQLDFKDDQINLKFVSNIHYNFDSRSLFFANEISDQNNKDDIIKKVQLDLPELKSVDLEILQFEKSQLNFDGHETHLLGEIEIFLCDYFNEAIQVRATSFYKILQNIGERSRIKSDRITTSEDLLKRKGFSSKEITKLLEDIEENSTQKISWDDICIFLNELSLSPLEKIQFKGSFENLLIKRIRTFDQITDLAFNFSREYVDNNIIDLSKSLEEFVEVFKSKFPEHIRLFSDIDIKTILLWVYCEKAKFQDSNPKN